MKTRPFTILASAFVSACLLASAVMADPGDERPQGAPPDNPRADRPEPGRGPGSFGRRGFVPPQIPLMTALDADADGEISADEIANAAQTLKALDKNEDGKLTQEELRPQFSFGRRMGPPSDRQEARRPSDEGNRDPREEGRPPFPPRGPRPEFGRGPEFHGPAIFIEQVMKLDADDDEQLTQAEVLELFSTIDHDQNGFLTRAELEDAAREFARHHFGEHRPHGHGPPHEGRRTRGGDRDGEHPRPESPDQQ